MNHTEGITEVTEAIRYCDDQYEKMYKNWKKKAQLRKGRREAS